MKIVAKKLKKKDASSLLEVVVAAAIMIIAFTGLIQVFIYSSYVSEMAGNITLAMQEAQSKVEEIRAHDFSSIATDYASGGTPGNTFTLAVLNGSGTVATSAVYSDLLQITVSVSWTEKNGRSMSTSISTLVADRE